MTVWGAEWMWLKPAVWLQSGPILQTPAQLRGSWAEGAARRCWDVLRLTGTIRLKQLRATDTRRSQTCTHLLWRMAWTSFMYPEAM